MFFIDATCPLVSKVHREAERHFEQGDTIILIGHAGHPEVIGTMGQLPSGAVMLVETLADVAALKADDPEHLAYCTQTTLSVDDTAAIVEALQKKFPAIKGPRKEDICYATTLSAHRWSWALVVECFRQPIHHVAYAGHLRRLCHYLHGVSQT